MRSVPYAVASWRPIKAEPADISANVVLLTFARLMFENEVTANKSRTWYDEFVCSMSFV